MGAKMKPTGTNMRPKGGPKQTKRESTLSKHRFGGSPGAPLGTQGTRQIYEKIKSKIRGLANSILGAFWVPFGAPPGPPWNSRGS